MIKSLILVPDKGGAFEISWREADSNAYRPNTKIYSKLETKNFPEEEKILEEIEKLLGTSSTEGKPVETEGKGT